MLIKIKETGAIKRVRFVLPCCPHKGSKVVRDEDILPQWKKSGFEIDPLDRIYCASKEGVLRFQAFAQKQMHLSAARERLIDLIGPIKASTVVPDDCLATKRHRDYRRALRRATRVIESKLKRD